MAVKLSKRKIVVAGDIMLDRYIMGQSTRISQEAPVPIVRVPEGRGLEMCGGAANVACACKTLGVGEVTLFGFVGDDHNAAIIRGLLHEAGVLTHAIITHSTARTTTKTRVMVDGKQICRLDEEDIYQDYVYTTAQISEFHEACSEADAIIISDYNKGAITSAILDTATRIGKKTFLDPKPEHKSIYRNHDFVAVKPNERELFLMAPEDDPAHCAMALCREMGCNVVATRGQYGAIVVEPGDMLSLRKGDIPRYIQGRAVEIADTIGAGDVFIATLASVWTIDKDIVTAAKTANIAASLSVQRPFTECPTMPEILEAKGN
jgi:rfaE bifunctional protein kinase chain/domain